MTRHRRGEPITADQARAETKALMDDADARRGLTDDPLRLPRYVEKPTADPAEAPTGLIDVTQPIELADDSEPRLRARPNLLHEAARLLRARGRCTHRLIDDRGCMCPVAAVVVTIGIKPDEIAAFQAWLDDPDKTGEPPHLVYGTFNQLPEAHHLAAVVRRSGSGWAARRSSPSHTLWYWADRVDDDEVLRLLDAAADTYEAVPA